MFKVGYTTVCPRSSYPFYAESYCIKWVTTSWSDSICPRSNDPFYIVSYYIKWVTASWTHSIYFSWVANSYIEILQRT